VRAPAGCGRLDRLEQLAAVVVRLPGEVRDAESVLDRASEMSAGEQAAAQGGQQRYARLGVVPPADVLEPPP
jgi:hypothetical protein